MPYYNAGNCRLTLRGHRSAPSMLSLGRAGATLLSADKERLDRSVRLWDLHTGKELIRGVQA